MPSRNAHDTWERYVGEQSPYEFVRFSIEEGHATIGDAIASYLADEPAKGWLIESGDDPDKVADGLKDVAYKDMLHYWEQEGEERGENIASLVDVPDRNTTYRTDADGDVTVDCKDAAHDVMVARAHESEQDGREFSPFEFTAAGLNDLDAFWGGGASEEAWDAFDDGITHGIETDVRARLSHYTDEDFAPLRAVMFHAHNGSMPRNPVFAGEEDEARSFCAKWLRTNRRAGYKVRILERGSDWEVLEPASAGMIDDEVGILSIQDQEPGRTKW